MFIPSPGIGHFRSTTAVAKLIVDSDERISVTLIVIPPRFSNHASSSYPSHFAQEPQGFLERTAEIGKIISWAPQIDVLKTDAVGGFVTHCGWNSTLESLWFGAPTAAWPIYAEQQFNAFHMVEELGLAAEIRKDYRGDNMLGESEMVTAKEIESGINCVMDQGSEMRKKVKKMSDKLHVVWMDGGSSNTTLKKFVQDVVENVP